MSLAPIWAWQQPDLFEGVSQTDLQYVAKVEQSGQNAADKDWLQVALDAIKLVAEEQSLFTTDSVWSVLAHWQTRGPTEERAIGALMQKARRAGWCEATSQTQPSVRPVCHGRRLTIWHSLIFSGVH